MSNVHVIFGAGQIGASLATQLTRLGHRVRVVRRSEQPVGEGIEVRAGDARDPAFARAASDGAAVVYHCMNPSAYTSAAWEREFPVQGDALIAAAIAVGARLVCLDNLYAYGPTDARRTEDSPLRAEGRKGRVRIAWDARLRQAGRDEGLRFVAGRAGDFFGPGVGASSLMSPAMVQGLAAGKAPWLIGDVRAVHAFSFVPDVVAALLALGTADDDVEGHVYHLPVHEIAPADLVARVAAHFGETVTPRSLPRWAITGLSPVVPLMRELRETLYQWDRPFLVDDRRFRARFPGVGSTLDEAVAETARKAGAAAPIGHVRPGPRRSEGGGDVVVAGFSRVDIAGNVDE